MTSLLGKVVDRQNKELPFENIPVDILSCCKISVVVASSTGVLREGQVERRREEADGVRYGRIDLLLHHSGKGHLHPQHKEKNERLTTSHTRRDRNSTMPVGEVGEQLARHI
jgi:hypothetical protein